jgi:hypothetical protein
MPGIGSFVYPKTGSSKGIFLLLMTRDLYILCIFYLCNPVLRGLHGRPEDGGLLKKHMEKITHPDP